MPACPMWMEMHSLMVLVGGVVKASSVRNFGVWGELSLDEIERAPVVSTPGVGRWPPSFSSSFFLCSKMGLREMQDGGFNTASFETSGSLFGDENSKIEGAYARPSASCNGLLCSIRLYRRVVLAGHIKLSRSLFPPQEKSEELERRTWEACSFLSVLL